MEASSQCSDEVTLAEIIYRLEQLRGLLLKISEETRRIGKEVLEVKRNLDDLRSNHTEFERKLDRQVSLVLSQVGAFHEALSLQMKSLSSVLDSLKSVVDKVEGYQKILRSALSEIGSKLKQLSSTLVIKFDAIGECLDAIRRRLDLLSSHILYEVCDGSKKLVTDNVLVLGHEYELEVPGSWECVEIIPTGIVDVGMMTKRNGVTRIRLRVLSELPLARRLRMLLRSVPAVIVLRSNDLTKFVHVRISARWNRVIWLLSLIGVVAGVIKALLLGMMMLSIL